MPRGLRELVRRTGGARGAGLQAGVWPAGRARLRAEWADRRGARIRALRLATCSSDRHLAARTRGALFVAFACGIWQLGPAARP
eukprot:4045397-Prymnesium_polylepis.1